MKCKSLKTRGAVVLLFISLNGFSQQQSGPILLKGKNFDVEIQPASFSVQIKNKNGQNAYVSRPQKKSVVTNQLVNDNRVSWEFADKGIKASLELKEDYLDIDISAKQVNSFTWPTISEDVVSYMLPWHGGKYIPARDPKWIEFCNYAGTMTGIEDLSMQFLGINYRDFALVFIIKNMYNNELKLKGPGSLGLSFTHEFPATVRDKKYGFQVYLRTNDPVDIAKTYKDYLVSEGRFVTLEEKAEKNPNIRKLYGAPFIYLWGNQFVVKENVKNWNEFLQFFAASVNSTKSNISKQVLQLNRKSDAYNELIKICKEYKSAEAVGRYTKNLFTAALNTAMESPDFYGKDLWIEAEMDSSVKGYIAKGVANLTQVELYDLNRRLFFQAYRDYVEPVADWGNGTSLFLLDKLKEMNIKKAWLGLESFQPAYKHPEFLQMANDKGYLIGVYDSYHSIHVPGKEQWETAKFTDTTLYYTSAIINKDGSVNKGFQGVGRKLNPTLSLPSVKERVNDILANGFKFNSWFIDCDATGEVFDDYSKNHITSEEEDVKARLQRMAWIRDEKQMVIGSEGGNDFAATTIAFAHGLYSPGFVWNDLDWRKNKESKYYFGPYYSPDGGVALNASKQVPIKEIYHYIYYDCRFNLPLFQLVYNNSVIVSHHWGLGSLKAIDEVRNNKLREILYNFPPLYNLDRNEIVKQQKTIADHIRIFAETHARAVRLEMTGFGYLTNDKMVQFTRFGKELEIVANFSDKAYHHESDTIPAMSLLILYLGENRKEIYTPIQ